MRATHKILFTVKSNGVPQCFEQSSQARFHADGEEEVRVQKD